MYPGDPYEGVLLSGAMGGGSSIPAPVMTNIEPLNTFGMGMLQRRYPDEPDQDSTEAIIGNILGNLSAGGAGQAIGSRTTTTPTQMPQVQGGYGRTNIPASQSYVNDPAYIANTPGASYSGFSTAPPATGSYGTTGAVYGGGYY